MVLNNIEQFVDDIIPDVLVQDPNKRKQEDELADNIETLRVKITEIQSKKKAIERKLIRLDRRKKSQERRVRREQKNLNNTEEEIAGLTDDLNQIDNLVVDIKTELNDLLAQQQLLTQTNSNSPGRLSLLELVGALGAGDYIGEAVKKAIDGLHQFTKDNLLVGFATPDQLEPNSKTASIEEQARELIEFYRSLQLPEDKIVNILRFTFHQAVVIMLGGYPENDEFLDGAHLLLHPLNFHSPDKRAYYATNEQSGGPYNQAKEVFGFNDSLDYDEILLACKVLMDAVDEVIHEEFRFYGLDGLNLPDTSIVPWEFCFLYVIVAERTGVQSILLPENDDFEKWLLDKGATISTIKKPHVLLRDQKSIDAAKELLKELLTEFNMIDSSGKMKTAVKVFYLADGHQVAIKPRTKKGNGP